jgi:YVTN family beta-propeller protein
MNDEDGTVSRIDPATDRVVRTQAIGQVVGGIATGAGAVWASEPIAGTISSINPRSGRPLPTKISGGGRLGAPGPVAVGYGAVWIGVDVPADQLVRYDPQARGVVARIRDVNIGDLKSVGTSGGVAVGGGSVWVSAPDTNEVLRVDPARNAIAGRIPIADGPAAIAFGDGAAWVVVPADDTVWRIDASDQTTRPIRVGRFPTGVAVGEGAVWVANEFAGTVSRVDPASNRLVTTIKVGHSPGAVAVGYGKVWAAVRAP